MLNGIIIFPEVISLPVFFSGVTFNSSTGSAALLVRYKAAATQCLHSSKSLKAGHSQSSKTKPFL